jgi:large subunit ribosomal protein L18
MNRKNTARLRRARRTRMKMREQLRPRLCVHRTLQHMYAQIIEPGAARVLVAASTLDKDMRDGKTGNVEAAGLVGTRIAERAVALGIRQIAFDRAGYKYHGRVKALADAARAAGLEF